MADFRHQVLRVVSVLGLAIAAATVLSVFAGVGEAHAAPPTPPAPIPVPSFPTPVNTPQIPDRLDPPVPTPPTPGTSGSSGSPGTGTDGSSTPSATLDLNLPDVTQKTSNSVVLILLLTVLSVAPSLLVLCTSFTRIVIVLGLTRNAIGIPSIPPQQVIVGLSVFLTLFVMGPTLGQMKTVALDPLLDGKITTSQAFERVQVPLRGFLLEHTRESELKLFLDASHTATPVDRDKVPLNALIPAFVLSELKSAFIMGFVIFVPFLVIDLVVSAVLMGLGMMMLPPSFVSLPFKLLLFIMLDGWMLVTGMLLTSYK